jgi:hypothetical protein
MGRMLEGHARWPAGVLAIVTLLAVCAAASVFAIKDGWFESTHHNKRAARTAISASTVPSFGYSPPVTRQVAIETVKRDRAEIEPGAALAAKLVGAPATPTWLV